MRVEQRGDLLLRDHVGQAISAQQKAVAVGERGLNPPGPNGSYPPINERQCVAESMTALIVGRVAGYQL
jgi:hypothetical protein